jgi:hypothetical protein
MSKSKDEITLKWGTLKEWRFVTPECKELFAKYESLGSSVSAMMQRDTDEQKQLICEMIDKSNVESVFLDWDGIYVSKEDAKKYVMKERK